MVWIDTHAAAWALRERLKSSDLTNYLHNLLRDQAPRFIDGSIHTPLDEVQVLGSEGMRIETLRGSTRVTPDGDATAAQLTVGAIGDPNVVIGNGTVIAESISYSPNREVQFTIPLNGGALSSGWSLLPGIGVTPHGPFITQDDTSGAATASFPLPRLPTGCTIKTFGFLLDGNGGGNNHASLPATRPTLSLVRVDGSTRAPTTVGSVTDASADVAAYQTLHWTDRAGNLAHVTIAGDQYFLTLAGETGANAVNIALRVYGLRLTFTASQVL